MGTIQITVNLLLQKLIHELDRRNITDITDETAYERFVADCVLALPSECGRTPPSGTDGPTMGLHVGGTAEGVCGPTKNEPSVGADLSCDVSLGSKPVNRPKRSKGSGGKKRDG